MSDVTHPILDQAEGRAIPVQPLAEGEVEAFLARKRTPVRTYAAANRFSGKAGQVLAIPGPSGAVEQVLLGLGSGRADVSLLRGLAGKLPAGDYALAKLPKGVDASQAALAFALGTYRFDRYKKRGEPIPRLVAPKGVDAAAVTAMAHACALARDMVNTPANDMGPLQIETIAGDLVGRPGR
jgi:leucyl aminopeptidase